MKELKDLYNENYKTLLEEIEEDIDISCSWIRRLNIVKTAVLPQLVRFSENPNPNSNCCFYRNWQADPISLIEIQGTWNSQNNLEKVQQAGGLKVPFSKLASKLQ